MAIRNLSNRLKRLEAAAPPREVKQWVVKTVIGRDANGLIYDDETYPPWILEWPAREGVTNEPPWKKKR